MRGEQAVRCEVRPVHMLVYISEILKQHVYLSCTSYTGPYSWYKTVITRTLMSPDGYRT